MTGCHIGCFMWVWRLPGEVGSSRRDLVRVAARIGSVARGSQRFALLQIHLEGIPYAMLFSPFGLKKGSKSQTGSISLHLSCSVSLSDR